MSAAKKLLDSFQERPLNTLVSNLEPEKLVSSD